MKVEDYLERAHIELKVDNRIEALRILEEGCKVFRDPLLLEMIKEVKLSLKHLENKEAYRGFYEERQKGKSPNLLVLLERKIRGLIGKRTRKLLMTFPQKDVRYQQVERDIREGGFKSVLDIGCYEGRYSICLGARNPWINVEGIDIAQINIDKAKELNRFKNVSFKQGFAEDVHKLFKPNSFDFIMLFEVLEHVISVETVMASVFKVLKENGMVAITVPVGFENEEHVRYFSDGVIVDLFGHEKEFKCVKIHRNDKCESGKEMGWNYITFRK